MLDRFNEIGRAMWSLQLAYKKNAEEKTDWRFVSYIVDADVEPKVNDPQIKQAGLAGQILEDS